MHHFFLIPSFIIESVQGNDYELIINNTNNMSSFFLEAWLSTAFLRTFKNLSVLRKFPKYNRNHWSGMPKV